MNSTGSFWYVQLADGDVHRVTLDQLDEGFQAGDVDANTMVLAAGATRWAKLGELAGIDDVAPLPPKRSQAAEHTSVHLAPTPAEPPPSVASAAPSAPRARVAPPVSLAPAPLLHSHRPVSVDLGDLELAAGLPRRSGKRWFVALAGLATIASLAAVAVKRPALANRYLTRLGLHGIGENSTDAVVPPHLVTADSPPPVTALTTAPVRTAPAAGANTPPSASSVDPRLPDRLENDAKEVPPDAKKPLVPKTKAHKAHTPTGPSHSHGASSSKSPTFATGGSYYDPLNNNI